MNSRTSSGASNGMPSWGWWMMPLYGSRILSSRRQIQCRRRAVLGTRRAGSCRRPDRTAMSDVRRPAPPVWRPPRSGRCLPRRRRIPGKRLRTSGKLSAGIAISMVPCARVCLARNRSSAQPAATYQGVLIPANCCATSPGVQQDDHLAWRASTSSGDSSMRPLGSCSLTAGI